MPIHDSNRPEDMLNVVLLRNYLDFFGKMLTPCANRVTDSRLGFSIARSIRTRTSVPVSGFCDLISLTKERAYPTT